MPFRWLPKRLAPSVMFIAEPNKTGGAYVGRVIAGWAALGVALTSATQLRMAGLPLGPGEALLALWMAFVAFCLLRNVPFSYSAAFRPFLALLVDLGRSSGSRQRHCDCLE